MLKKIIIVFFVIILTKFFLGCGCPDANTYRWNGLSTYILTNETVTSTDSISFVNYGVGLAFGVLQIAHYQYNSFVNSAYARKCPTVLIESNIQKITVKTLSDFNSDHPAGSDITSYCKAKNFAGLNYFPVDELAWRMSLTEKNYWNMVLTERPDSIQNYQFVIDVLLENGTSFNDTTRSVIIY